jgi:DNA polymerase-1
VPATKTKPGPKAAEAHRDGELFLIDGNSLAYRAFFALPESIATADGRPTNAIYGFASMMAKILIEHRPQAVIVAWDAGCPGREESTRSTRPASVASRPARRAVAAPGAAGRGVRLHNVKVDGWEADDVIATLVRRAREAEIPVMVVSGDRTSTRWSRRRARDDHLAGVTDTKIYDRDGVIERYGVRRSWCPTLIGLQGRHIRQHPGVPGIGDKTAAQLLQQFGIARGGAGQRRQISGAKRKQNLTEHADDARISKQLATLKDDIDVPIDVRNEARQGLTEAGSGRWRRSSSCGR